MLSDWPYVAQVLFWLMVVSISGWCVGLGLKQVEISKRRRR